MAATETLTAERILEATEEVLRRHGPAKATVVDVARALGVSHGSVYRHFRTKAALREAVTKRWLDRTSEALDGIAGDASRDPGTRLRDWLAALFTAKRRKAGDDPELFATYSVLAGEQVGAVAEHIDELTEQLTRIVADGVAAGSSTATTPRSARGRCSRRRGGSTIPRTRESGSVLARTPTSRRWWSCCCGGCGPDRCQAAVGSTVAWWACSRCSCAFSHGRNWAALRQPQVSHLIVRCTPVRWTRTVCSRPCRSQRLTLLESIWGMVPPAVGGRVSP